MKKLLSFALSFVIAVSFPVAAFADGADGAIKSYINEITNDIFNSISSSADNAAAYNNAVPVSEIPTEPISGDSSDFSSEETSSEPVSEETSTEVVSEAPTTEPAPKVICFGDVNQDGTVTAADARLVLQFSAKLTTFSIRQCVIADCNKNKTVNAADARTVLRIGAKLEKTSEYKGNDSETEIVTQYSNPTPYKATLSGFSTNIMEPAVFDKISKLEKYCAALGQTATFYYTDVNRQYYIKYNSSRVYRTQCTIKAPYVKSILQYMEDKNISLNTLLYLKSSQKWSGHYMSNFASGTAFTIRQVIYYAIRYSDNTAYQMLFDYFGNEIFNANCKKVGSSLRLGSYIFGETSAEDMAKLFLDIYNYNGKYRDILFEDMENNTSRNRIAAGVPKGTRVLNKIGSGGSATVGYHDCAIIFTEMPCILIIYTSFNRDRWYDNLPFRRIAEHVIGINKVLEYY